MVSIWEKRERELKRLSELVGAPRDDRPDVHGVLLSDEITRLSQHHNLISPFNSALLKPAAYQLTVGDEFFLSGEFCTFHDDGSQIVIPPFEVVVIKTAETLCMPTFLIARWNLQVRQAYRGLLWVGGPQVDPGYVGHLFCPIYNLSDTPVTLHKGDQLAVIDFVKTTPVRHNSIPYPKNTRPILEDFGIDNLKSALFTRAHLKVTEIDQSLKSIETRFTIFTTFTVAALALLVSTMAALLKMDGDLRIPAAIWGSLILALSIFAASLAFLSFFTKKFELMIVHRIASLSALRGIAARKFLHRNWYIGLVTTAVVAACMALFIYFQFEPFFSELRQRQVLIRQDLVPLESHEKTITETLTKHDAINKQLLDSARDFRTERDQQNKINETITRRLDELKRQVEQSQDPKQH